MEEGSVVGGMCKREVREDEKEQLGLEFGSFYGHSQKLIRTELALLSSYGHSRGGVLRYPMFTLEQWEELKRQALIYKYLVSSAPIPAYLLYDRVVPNIPPLYPNPGRGVGGGYLNVLKFAGNVDPEPGRCRRTDGKKWRCSRDVAAPDQRYCERHMHRGRPRSRKPVEQPTPKITNSPSSKPLEPTVMQPVKEPMRYWDWNEGGSNDTQTNDFDHQQKQNSDLNDPCDSFLNPDISLEDASRPPRSFIDAWSSEISNKTSPITSIGNLSPSTLTLSMCAGEDENQTQMGLGIGDLSGSHPPSWMNMSDPLGGPLAEVLQSGTVSSPRNSSGHAEAASMGSRGGFMNLMGINCSGSDALVSPRDSPTGVLQRSVVSVSDSSGNSSPTFGVRSDLGLQWMTQVTQHNK